MQTHPVLARLARFGVRLGLDRMDSFLDTLGAPQHSFPVVHVAGTNGKGSTVRMIGSILHAAGHRVGEFTSPHLQHINERIQIDGRPISDDDLNALLEELCGSSRAWARVNSGGPQPLTYFEMMTAAAFLHMARREIDVAVIEVGLGGRLDATNVVDPAVTVITHIGLDHTAHLGPDVACIAAEKAGIVKPGRPLVVGPLVADAAKVIRTAAAERGVPLLEMGRHFRAHGGAHTMTWSDGALTLTELELSLPGDHQVENAAVAIAAVRQLESPPAEAAIRMGLRTARHRGRLEWLAPDLLVDCAHNGDGAARLADYLRALPHRGPRTLLLGMSDDKDVRRVVVALAPWFDRVFTTCCTHPRALSPGDLAERITGLDVPVLPAGPIEQALPLARGGDRQVVVAGSVFLAGAVRELVGAR